MTDFMTLVQERRSHRRFTKRQIDGDAVQLILRAALMSPSSMARRTWHFILVEDKTDIEKISEAKAHGASFLREAPLLVVITGDVNENDCWIEDGSIAAITMQYQAHDLGLASCWVQMDKRGLTDGTTANQVVQGILDIPENQQVLCVLGIGYPADNLPPQDEEMLKWENVHIGKF